MRDKPHVTVVIPTRERADVLEKSLMSCVTQDYDNLTILVSDNFSQDGTRSVAQQMNDPRIQYVSTGKRVSMSHNYEFALSHVKDGWVTIIGDDDGLLPGAIEKVAGLIASTNLHAIRSDVCFYRWPGLPGAESGSLTVPLKRGVEVRKSKDWLSRVMRGTALYPSLPMLYTGGFVDTTVLQQIIAHDGRFYHSCIPDVFSAFAIASVIDEYLWSSEPLALDGVSRHSTGTSHVNPLHDKAPIERFFSEENIPLHPDIPPDQNGNLPRVHQAWLYEAYLQSQFLRKGPSEITPSDQLKIALKTASPGSPEIEWGQTFAKRHGLDFEGIRAEAKKYKIRSRMSEVLNRAHRALTTHPLQGGRSALLPDVYEASRQAGFILKDPPGPIARVRGLAEKSLLKLGPLQGKRQPGLPKLAS